MYLCACACLYVCGVCSYMCACPCTHVANIKTLLVHSIHFTVELVFMFIIVMQYYIQNTVIWLPHFLDYHLVQLHDSIINKFSFQKRLHDHIIICNNCMIESYMCVCVSDLQISKQTIGVPWAVASPYFPVLNEHRTL